MVAKRGGYVPRCGDVIWLSFDPQVGHEQAGRRPALVLSSTEYNRTVGLAVVCPITNQSKGYPFEVAVPNGLKVSGVVLADQAKSIDWVGREAKFLCQLPKSTVLECIGKLSSLLGGA
jgi:mRNA interferase MazF